jgi:hypothetical protein
MADETNGLIDTIASEPEGTLKLFRAIDEHPAVEQSITNQLELVGRIEHAKASGCLIEVISLRLQYLDLWLRIFFENKPKDEPRQREFVRLLKQCLKQGFDKSLYDRILKFNRERVDAIHGYLIGAINYEKIASVIEESNGLSEAVAQFVVLNCGEPISHSFANERHGQGEMVYHIARLLARLRSGPFI